MNLEALIFQAERDCQPVFSALEQTEMHNTRRILDAFRAEDIAARHLSPTTGYGYDDAGRAALEKIYAEVFGAEKALVRLNFVNGSHAIACAMTSLRKASSVSSPMISILPSATASL